MPAWAWILIIVVLVAIAAFVAWSVMAKRRTGHLRDRFGPEYDRAVREQEGRRGAERELTQREKRREELEIRPLAPEARQRYADSWRNAQARFVDQPSEAVHEADLLVVSVMRDRGYPMEDFEQRSADISVDHPQVVDNYRAAHGISLANDHDQASTEDLRQAMVHYRALFEELLGDREDVTRQREVS
jgi:hypothetical protein